MWQMTYAFLLRLAQAAIGHGGSPAQGPLFGAWIGLAQQGTPPPTPQSTMAQIIEANYDGYSRQQITWFPPFVSSAGPEQITAQDLFFSPIDALVGNQIVEVFISDAFYAGTLLGAAVLPFPGAFLAGPQNAIKVQPVFQLTTALVYGAPQIVN